MKRKSTQVLAALLALFALSAMCFGGALPFAGTVGTPKDRIEAVGTATAIAPAIVPTVRYNEVVLPTQQAEEANQIIATVKRQYENTRTWDDFSTACKKIVVGTLTVFGAIAVASGAGAIVGAVLCYVVERIKRAHAYEPVQILPDKALYYPRYNMLVDSRTARTWKVTTYSDADVDHGAILVDRLLTNGKRPRFQFRNEERHPATVLDAVKLPAQIQARGAPEPDVIGA